MGLRKQERRIIHIWSLSLLHNQELTHQKIDKTISARSTDKRATLGILPGRNKWKRRNRRGTRNRGADALLQDAPWILGDEPPGRGGGVLRVGFRGGERPGLFGQLKPRDEDEQEDRTWDPRPAFDFHASFSSSKQPPRYIYIYIIYLCIYGK